MRDPAIEDAEPLNAFCIDLEEWFHVCGVRTDYSDPATWDKAAAHVVRDTEVLMRLLEDAGARATIMTVGWVAERYPRLIQALVDSGHEIGCHSYFHRLIYDLSPQEFEDDLIRCLGVLRETSGQAVRVFPAPGFSMNQDCFWAYPILRRHGVDIDASIVPAKRDHGGVDGFTRDPFLLQTAMGSLRVMPVSVMRIAGKTVPFSGGGYLRLFPQAMINWGYRQNHRQGRPGMLYIHPREINPAQPRLELPRLKYFKYYVNLGRTEEKLRRCLKAFRFSTVSDVLTTVRRWPEYELVDGSIRPLSISG